MATDSSSERLGALALLSWSIVLFAGCSEDGNLGLPSPEEAGEHLRFWAEREGDVCGGTLQHLDAYVGRLKTEYHTHPAPRVDYYWVENVETPCVAEACSIEGAVITPHLPHRHELVHAVRYSLGYAQSFLEEGAAEYQGDVTDRESLRREVADGFEFGEEGHLPFEFYDTAGAFSAYLAREFGAGALRELAEATEIDDSVAFVDQAFIELFNTPLAVVVRDFEERRPSVCTRANYSDVSLLCDVAQKVECADEGRASLEVDLSCSSADAIGSRQGDRVAYYVAEFDGTPNLEASIPEGELGEDREIEIRPCISPGLCVSGGWELDVGSTLSDSVLLAPDRYLVTVRSKRDPSRSPWGTVALHFENLACE